MTAMALRVMVRGSTSRFLSPPAFYPPFLRVGVRAWFTSLPPCLICTLAEGAIRMFGACWRSTRHSATPCIHCSMIPSILFYVSVSERRKLASRSVHLLRLMSREKLT